MLDKTYPTRNSLPLLDYSSDTWVQLKAYVNKQRDMHVSILVAPTCDTKQADQARGAIMALDSILGLEARHRKHNPEGA